MKTPTRVHCFFEQSGTFKNEFIKLGIPAEDYDIQNHFGQTDHVIDLFAQIEAAYDGKVSVFDTIKPSDLIMAFFPCIEFSCVAQLWYSLTHKDFRKWDDKRKVDYIIEKNRKRSYMFELLNKFCCICLTRGLRMVFENPWSENTYLKANFIIPPALIDNNRMLRGDYRVKPTAYWFVNCEPTHGRSIQFDKLKEKKTHMTSKGSSVAGVCSEERSMISPDYARNFICDFIIGKEQEHTERTLFDL